MTTLIFTEAGLRFRVAISEAGDNGNGLALLGTNRVEIEEHICPFTVQIPPEVLHSSHQNVFAGVAEGYAAAPFGEQEEEL